jgi:hypothetical protein
MSEHERTPRPNKSRERAIERLRQMPDEQIRALGDKEFWDVIEPEGVCPGCDPRISAEIDRRIERGPLN